MDSLLGNKKRYLQSSSLVFEIVFLVKSAWYAVKGDVIIYFYRHVLVVKKRWLICVGCYLILQYSSLRETIKYIYFVEAHAITKSMQKHALLDKKL